MGANNGKAQGELMASAPIGECKRQANFIAAAIEACTSN